jgi:plastocyanin
MKRLWVILIALAAVAALLTAAGCGAKETAAPKTTPKTTPSTSPSAGETGSTVLIKDFAFKPSAITVQAGTTVTWKNEDSTVHTVTGSGFDSGQIQPGAEFQKTFDAAGTYDYHCSIHPSMTGQVTVE